MSSFRSVRALVTAGALATGVCSSGSAVVAATPLVSCASASEGPDATTDAMSSILSRTKKRDNLRAIIFGAERNGRPILRTALGMSTTGVPATTAMHFRVGFVGWQYLTDVLLLMADRKQIALTDPVSKWFPEYPHADLATVHMLAASSTGFGDYITPPAFAEEIYVNQRRVWTAGDLITKSLPPYQKPAFTNPGKNWAYSHTNFVMLGAILERVAGKPYTSLLQELILGPLALHDTRLQFDSNPQLPVLHTLDDETFKDTTFWNPSWVSWAAMTSNVCDLGTWSRAFGTGSLLSTASKSRATARVNVGLGPNTANTYFGLGTIVNAPWIVAKASYWGMYTSTAYDPSTGISLEVTVSLNPGAAPKNPSGEIVSAMSELLTPDHPIPN
jgi:CubicO group peptidase (beta-lactamase class C family)